DIFRARIQHDYFTVFNATCSRIGTLGPLAPQVVNFYAVGKSFLEDVAELGELCARLTTSQAILDRATLLGISRAARDFLSWIGREGPQVFSGSMNTQLAGGFSIRPTPESTDANFLIDVDRRPAELEGP